MGYGGEKFCYYNKFNEQGEILASELVDSISLYRRNNRHTYNNNNNNSNIFSFSHGESNSYNIISYINSDINSNDINSQLDSRILENVDNLSPEKKRCTICLENFVKYNKIINLSCLHMFHDECIKKWLKKNNYCPICKNEV